MNLLNLNPYIFWSVVAGPGFLGAWKPHPADSVAFLQGLSAAALLVLGAPPSWQGVLS
jgi:hypothetical protein